MNINELFEHSVATTERVYAEAPPDYEQMCMFVAHSAKNDSLYVMATPWANETEKVAILQSVKEHMQELDVDFYVFVGEAWTVAVKTREEIEKVGAPSEHPNRVEITFICACDKAGEVLNASWRIHRGEKGIKLERMGTHTHSEGRIVDLLK